MNKPSVYLRYIEAKDALLVLDWENNQDNWAVSDNDSPYSIYDIALLIDQLQDIHKAKQARWMICLTNQDQPIGNIDLTEIDFDGGVSTVGILIADPENRRKGYASESIQLIVDEAISLGVNKLNCTIHVDNQSSISLFKKNGFKKIGKIDAPSLSNGSYIDVLKFEKWLKK